MKKIIALVAFLLIATIYFAIPSKSSKLKDMGFESYKSWNIIKNVGTSLDHSFADAFGGELRNAMNIGIDRVVTDDKIVVTTKIGKKTKSTKVYFTGYFPYKNEVYVHIKKGKENKVFKINASKVEIKKL